MVQRGQKTRLALEALQGLRIESACIGQHLERDVALQPRVADAIDLAHPAHADELDDFVQTKTIAGRECHRSSTPISAPV